MKKVFLMTLAILVILLSLPAVAMADTLPTVYVGGTGAADTNDGLTEGTAVATFAQAYTALGGNGGTIVVCGDMSITANTTFPSHNGVVTITGKDGTSPKIDIAGSLDIEFVGETVIQNITFNHTAGSGCTDFYPGKSLTFGEGVTMKNKGSAYTSGNLFVVRMGSQTSKLSDSTFNMASGTLNMIAGGEDYGVANSNINISGGSVLTSMAAGGLGGKTIDHASVTVSGGTVTTVNISGGANPLALGGCEITIKGGTVGSIGGVTASSTSGTLSKVDITLDGTSVGSGGIDLTSLTGKSGVSITDGPNLTVKNAEYISLGNSLSEFKSLSLENATLEITGTYAGPSSVSVDASSTLILPEGTALPANTVTNGGSVVANTPLEKVYLNGSKTSSGFGNTPENAVNTLSAAFDKLSDNGGTIVVCGNITLDLSELTETKNGIEVYDFPAKNGTVTITGKDGETSYAPIIELADDGKWHLQCNSPMVFEHLTFDRTGSRCAEFFTGESLTFGEGIVCQYDGGEIPESTAGYICVRLGYCYNAGEKTCPKAEFTMKSGTLSFIQGGSGKNAVTESNITMTGGKIVDILQCGGAGRDVGTSNVSIQNATIRDFYINGWGAANLGGSTITIKDSNITYLSDHRTDSNSNPGTAKISGNASLTLEKSIVGSMSLGNISWADDASFSLTVKDVEYLTLDKTLASTTALTLVNSTVEVTNSYAGPASASVDASSTLIIPADTASVPSNTVTNGGSILKNEPLSTVYLNTGKATSGYGNTPENAVNTIAAAYGKLPAAGGTIVLCGDLTINSNYSFPAHEGAVTITSKDGTTAVIHAKSGLDIEFRGETVFKNVTFNYDGTANCTDFYTGKSLTFGEGVTMLMNGQELTSTGNILAVRMGGKSATGNVGTATFNMQSGAISFVAGSQEAALTTSNVNISGGKVMSFVTAGGLKGYPITNANVSITGGEVLGTVGVSGGANPVAVTNAVISVKDATIGGIVGTTAANGTSGTMNKAEITLDNVTVTDSIEITTLTDDVTVTNGAHLTLKNMTGVMFKNGLEGWTSFTMEGSTAYVTKAYAGPETIAADVGSVLTLNANCNTEADKPGVDGDGKVVLDTVYEGSYVEQLLLSTTSVVPDETRSGANQGTAIYGDYVVQCHDNGYANIYDLTSDTPGTPIAAFKLGSYNDGSIDMRPSGETWDPSYYRNHANQAMFGAKKWDESDPFPLLYVTTGKKGYKMEDGSYIAKCAVERIRYDEINGWYSQLVQVIEFNDAGYTDLGSGHDGTVTLKDGKFTYSGTSTWTNSEGYEVPCWGWPASFVDSSPTADTQGKFYLHSARFCTADSAIGQTATHNYATGVGNGNDLQTGVKIENFDNYKHNAYIITEFDMPALPESEADFGKTVTLTPEDITDQFTTEYDIWVTQGGTMYQGRIYYSFGFGTQAEVSHNGIRVFDIAMEKLIGKIDLYKDSAMKNVEPECCAIYKGHLALGYVSDNKHLWVFDYIESIEMPLSAGTCEAEAVTHTFDCLTNKTLRTFTGEKDADNHAGGTEVRGAVTETCTTPGYTGDTYCLGCGGKLQTGTQIPAKDHSFTTYESNGDATCEADGTETAKCDHAGCTETDSRTDADSKLGHSFTKYTANGDAACTADGTKTAKCDNNCGKSDTVTDTGSKGHKLTAVEAKAATVEAEGNIAHYACTVCGKLYADETAAKELTKAEVTTPKLESSTGEPTTEPTTQPTEKPGDKPANTAPATGDAGVTGAVAMMVCSMLGMTGIAVSAAKKKED